MYDHQALPRNAVSPLDPRNKPLPRGPPTPSRLSSLSTSSHSSTAASASWQMAVPRRMPAPRSPIVNSRTSSKMVSHQQQHHHHHHHHHISQRRQPQPHPHPQRNTASLSFQQKHGGDLYTFFSPPARTPVPFSPYASYGGSNYNLGADDNGGSRSSVCGDSISSSTFSLPLTPSYALTASSPVEPHSPRGGQSTTTTTPISISMRRIGEEEEEGGREEKETELPRPRPDSTVLCEESSPLRLRPSQQLDGRYFWALAREGDTVHYWLPVDLVLRGFPGKAYLPRGHWERLVKLAEDVRLNTTAPSTEGRGARDGEMPEGGAEADMDERRTGGRPGAVGKFVQLIRGRCSVDEPLGEVVSSDYEGPGRSSGS